MSPISEHHLQEEAEARVGQTLRGKWCLDALLGFGGMAAVYAATHRNGIRCAVKVLHPDCSVDPRVRERFLREGKIANQVDHPGVVRVLDDDVTEDAEPFLVMELLEGKALHDLAADSGGKLDVPRVLLVVHQLLDALAAAHDKGVLHRDVKPENVFVTNEGRVKILDFGIALFVEAAGAARATQTGTPMGTPAFMAPEQARGRWDLVGPQSDVWAVGATMFTLLSGRMVHDGETMQELLVAVISKQALSLATVAPDVPAEVVAIVDRALALEMEDRWDDARAMRDAVRAAYVTVTGDEMPAPPQARTQLSVATVAPRAKLPSGSAHGTNTISSVETRVSPPVAKHPSVRMVAAAAAGVVGVVSLLSFLPRASSETARAAASLAPPNAAVDVAVLSEAVPVPVVGAAPAAIDLQGPSRVAVPSASATPKTRTSKRPRRTGDLKALYDRRL